MFLLNIIFYPHTHTFIFLSYIHHLFFTLSGYKSITLLIL